MVFGGTAPDAVFALREKVHVGNLPADSHRLRLVKGRVQNPGNDDPVVSPALDDGFPVKAFPRRGAAGNGHAVVLAEQLAQIGKGQLHKGHGDFHPHLAGGGILLQGVGCLAGVQPEGAVFRGSRGFRAGGITLIGGSVGLREGKAHRALGGDGRAQITEFAGLDVVILLVRPDEHKSAHAHKLLFRVGNGAHPEAVVKKVRPVNPAQLVPAKKAVGTGKLPDLSPLFPGPDQRSFPGRKILHVKKLAVPTGAGMAVAPEPGKDGPFPGDGGNRG